MHSLQAPRRRRLPQHLPLRATPALARFAPSTAPAGSKGTPIAWMGRNHRSHRARSPVAPPADESLSQTSHAKTERKETRRICRSIEGRRAGRPRLRQRFGTRNPAHSPGPGLYLPPSRRQGRARRARTAAHPCAGDPAGLWSRPPARTRRAARCSRRCCGDFTAKDFRTWHGSVHALALWTAELGVEASGRRSARQLLAEVAHRLGNTVAVCRKAYVHPQVPQLLSSVASADAVGSLRPALAPRCGLSDAERRFLGLLAQTPAC